MPITSASPRGMSRNQLRILIAGLVLLVTAAGNSPAQTYQVIHNFSSTDGSGPFAGLTLDAAGNLYGTTGYGGSHGCGNVFKLSPHGSSWVLNQLYSFQGDTDGCEPAARVVFGPSGILYGSNFDTIFSLRPPPNRPTSVLSPWMLTTLYTFGYPYDTGEYPTGDVIFDSTGNLYGAAEFGGIQNQDCYSGCGTIFELSPSGGGNWTESTLYSFTDSPDGSNPVGVIFDSAGDILGPTSAGGGHSGGMLFELSRSGSGWTESRLHAFDYQDGAAPAAGLVADSAGNYYGSAGTAIFELSPSNGGWTYTVLYNLPESYDGWPTAPLTLDAAGNIYGTINGYCQLCPGAIFKLTNTSGGWTFTSLHDFTGGDDGSHPSSTVLFDAAGNAYGTSSWGGTHGEGVVWEITP